MKAKINESELVVKRLKERINFVRTKSDIHDPNCTEWNMELAMLQKILRG